MKTEEQIKKEFIDNYIRNIAQIEIKKAKIEEIKLNSELDEFNKGYLKIQHLLFEKNNKKNNFNLFKKIQLLFKKGIDK